MRLLLTFVALLGLASIGMTFAWAAFTPARNGEAAMGLAVLLGVAVALASVTGLARIVYRISVEPGLKGGE